MQPANFYACYTEYMTALEALKLLHIRENFYAISLVHAPGLCHPIDKGLSSVNPVLTFFHSRRQAPERPPCEEASGFFCMFKDSFLTAPMRKTINALPMFDGGGSPVYALRESQEEYLVNVFRNIHAEAQSDYIFKNTLLQTYIMELIHYALKITH